jgi:hypothetical protein
MEECDEEEEVEDKLEKSVSEDFENCEDSRKIWQKSKIEIVFCGLF